METIQIGKFYPFYRYFTDAQFQPLHSQEYNLVSKILPATPLSYDRLNAIHIDCIGFIF